MASTRVCRTTGDVGPSVLPRHWNYRPFERRDYGDGLVMLLEMWWHSSSTDPDDINVIGTVWIAVDGLNGGWHRRRINSPADIGALYSVFRRGLTEIGLYPLWDADGHRNRLAGNATVRHHLRSEHMRLKPAVSNT